MPPGLDYFPNVPALPLSTNAKQVVFLRTLSKEISQNSVPWLSSVFSLLVFWHTIIHIGLTGRHMISF